MTCHTCRNVIRIAFFREEPHILEREVILLGDWQTLPIKFFIHLEGIDSRAARGKIDRVLAIAICSAVD